MKIPTLAKLLAASFFFTSIAFASTPATITVKGMVCESCAESVTAKLKSNSDVESVAVNVKKGLVDIALKDGAVVTDEALKLLIADAGYTALSITRKS